MTFQLLQQRETAVALTGFMLLFGAFRLVKHDARAKPCPAKVRVLQNSIRRIVDKPRPGPHTAGARLCAAHSRTAPAPEKAAGEAH